MKAETTRQTYRVPCEIHTCRNRAGYKLGNAKFPHTCFNVCDDCMKEIVATLPDELLPVADAIEVEKINIVETDQKEAEETSEDNQQETSEETEGQEQEEEATSTMTIKELKALAEQRGIKLGSKVTKPELLQVLGVE